MPLDTLEPAVSTALESTPRGVEAPLLVLEEDRPGAPGRPILLDESLALIGTDELQAVPLASAGDAPRHATITRIPPVWVFQASGADCRRNQRAVRVAMLQAGDRLTVAGREFSVRTATPDDLLAHLPLSWPSAAPGEAESRRAGLESACVLDDDDPRRAAASDVETVLIENPFAQLGERESALASREQELAAREQGLRERETDVATREASLSESLAGAQAYRAEGESLRQAAEQRWQEITQFAARLNEREGALRQSEAALVGRETHLESRLAETRQERSELEQRTRDLEHRACELDEATARLAEREEALRAREAAFLQRLADAETVSQQDPVPGQPAFLSKPRRIRLPGRAKPTDAPAAPGLIAALPQATDRRVLVAAGVTMVLVLSLAIWQGVSSPEPVVVVEPGPAGERAHSPDDGQGDKQGAAAAQGASPVARQGRRDASSPSAIKPPPADTALVLGPTGTAAATLAAVQEDEDPETRAVDRTGDTGGEPAADRNPSHDEPEWVELPPEEPLPESPLETLDADPFGEIEPYQIPSRRLPELSPVQRTKFQAELVALLSEDDGSPAAQREQAERRFQSARKLSPSDPRVPLAGALAAWRRGDAEVAVEHAQAAGRLTGEPYLPAWQAALWMSVERGDDLTSGTSLIEFARRLPRSAGDWPSREARLRSAEWLGSLARYLALPDSPPERQASAQALDLQMQSVLSGEWRDAYFRGGQRTTDTYESLRRSASLADDVRAREHAARRQDLTERASAARAQATSLETALREPRDRFDRQEAEVRERISQLNIEVRKLRADNTRLKREVRELKVPRPAAAPKDRDPATASTGGEKAETTTPPATYPRGVEPPEVKAERLASLARATEQLQNNVAAINAKQGEITALTRDRTLAASRFRQDQGDQTRELHAAQRLAAALEAQLQQLGPEPPTADALRERMQRLSTYVPFDAAEEQRRLRESLQGDAPRSG